MVVVIHSGHYTYPLSLEVKLLLASHVLVIIVIFEDLRPALIGGMYVLS